MTAAPPLSTTLQDTARAVAAVLAGQSLTDALAQVPAARRPAAQALAFYALRTLGRAQALRDVLVARRPADADIDALLLVALTLLDAALDASTFDAPQYTPHTLVNQAVQACARKPAFKGLVNAVLRRTAREHAALAATIADQPLARWNHPDWWVARVKADYPDDWQRLLTIANQHAPLALRVNARRATREHVLRAFADAGIDANAVPDNDCGLVLDTPRPVTLLPGFHEGWWSVQDPGAQVAAQSLPISDGMRVLDACAAPGGKTAHMLERADVDMLALDADAGRLARVHENLTRLGLWSDRVKLHAGDAANPADWWDGQPFDVVLADAPCTASGIVRRHPDIRWLRQPADVNRTARLQRRILDALWPCVARGGVLLYATCSIFVEENETQARAFLARHPDAQRLPAPGQLLPVGNETDATRQHDGFYYAVFARR